MNKIELEKLRSKLLVEGNDDFHVVSAICMLFNVKQTFGIIDIKGIDKLLEQIPVRIKNREEYLGILVDADVDIQARWQQLRTILIPQGYEMPNEPSIEGTIVQSETADTVIGIWIMPNNQVPGMLEDFAQILIPDSDLILPVATRVVDEVLSMQDSKLKSVHRSKAVIHAWLALQESPGTPMGLAITKTYLDHNNEICVLFVGWLNRLFNSSEEVEKR